MANYLYNGIELPELPDWDRDRYPYATIYSGYLVQRRLLVSDKPVVYRQNDIYIENGRYDVGDWVYMIPEPVSVMAWDVGNYVDGKPTEWKPNSAASGERDYYFLTNEAVSWGNKWSVFWTNYPLIMADGSLMEASEPVPVGGSPEPTFVVDPASMTLGWLIGSRIAAQRGKQPVIPDEPVVPEAVIYQTGNTLTIISGVTVTQRESLLSIR